MTPNTTISCNTNSLFWGEPEYRSLHTTVETNNSRYWYHLTDRSISTDILSYTRSGNQTPWLHAQGTQVFIIHTTPYWFNICFTRIFFPSRIWCLYILLVINLYLPLCLHFKFCVLFFLPEIIFFFFEPKYLSYATVEINPLRYWDTLKELISPNRYTFQYPRHEIVRKIAYNYIIFFCFLK